MKILTAEQIRAADSYTIMHEPISSIALMERAADTCSQWITNHFPKDTFFIVICGTGNNGGDGLAIARLLLENGYNAETFIIPFFSKSSEDFLTNKERLENIKDAKIIEIKEADDITLSQSTDSKIIIIDALLGSGLSKPVEGKLGEVIQKINSLNLPVISVDMPSGLAIEDNTAFDKKNIIKATFTLTFETPKLSFLFADNAEFVGEFYILDIGINKKFLAEQKSSNNFATESMAAHMLRHRARFSHKGTYGHALLIAGGYGKMGAAILGAKSCLRAGAGLLTIHIPQCGYEILQTSVPEAMVMTDEEERDFSGVKDLSEFNAIGIGPGIGTSEKAAKGLKMLIQQAAVNMVLDADALNILSENKTWLSFLKPGCIITPHPGEFARLAGKSSHAFEAYNKQREFAIKYRIYVILKGAYTSIATPDGEVYFNSTGNPGMATAGSGDTLTGILLGLLAQGYPPLQAAILGVYIHGLAGDIAAHEWGENALIAEDITNNLGKAFQHLTI
jgi:ADP-dependent NAD(P)H-hydrate dehydratase / NAD(P)H-hydrate epimerase